MNKSFCSLGLMSGTSMDGVDASIIQSDGENEYRGISDKYFEYPKNIYNNLTKIRDKIKNKDTLKEFSKKIKILEKDITLFHAKIVNELIRDTKANIDLVGFHGQTIFHNANKKISKQLGDGTLLSRLTKKTVIYDFRQNDLKNGGEGAPLAPIFHKLLINKKKIKTPVMILNLGGIANWTLIGETDDGKDLHSADAGPGNCLIDQWMRKNSKQKYDKGGSIAKSGSINKTILNIGTENYIKFVEKETSSTLTNFNRSRSYDVKDFDISFVQGLSTKDGVATLTEYTSFIISEVINAMPGVRGVLVCGGGRKNKFLLKRISMKLKCSIQPIDNFGFDGDFIESQAFAYLAIRSYLKLPISFPSTTGVKKASTGGRVCKY